EADEYWKSVDLYIGGTEHATGHLIYSRFWNKFLYDLGYIVEKEPFKKLINQGMIQGRSNFVYRIKNTNTFVSYNLKDNYDTTDIHVDVNIVNNDRLNIEAFKAWMPDFANAEFILEEGEYICGYAVEKMSKSMFNVVNPDNICNTYGADTLRLYEMFLGPLEQSKPWDTKGIDGVNRFLKKFWRMFFNKEGDFFVSNNTATPAELKALHKLIKKVGIDIESFSFNTSISAFMIAINELQEIKCNKRDILEQVVILLAPFAPHITEELWSLLGHKESVANSSFPKYVEAYTIESSFEYPVSFNGKMRFKLELPKDMPVKEVEAIVRANENTAKYIGEGGIKKIIVVPAKIINVVC
ncbi:MAG: class I tRNA ligase family protein, partial [Bacteroidales bacterium]